MANHPNRNKRTKREDYAVQQAGFLLLELHKMLRDGPSHADYDKYRLAARRAALRAANSLDEGHIGDGESSSASALSN